MFATLSSALGIYAATAIAGVLCGLIPILNAELYLIGVVLLVHDVRIALVLAVLLSLGQMVAKAILYQAANKASEAGTGKFAERLERARKKVQQWERKRIAVLSISSVVGLPPFYVVTLVSGLLEIPFATFLAIGLTGRIVRFTAIALATVYF